jgi:predicted ribosome quality control (RQC) complex YloA/Tae2 family protein
MKTYLSSVDVRVLSRELDCILKGARFDKAYSLAGGLLRLRFHSSGVGMRELVVAPGFLCISDFKYPVKEKHSGFVMSLRKHLGGLFLRSVRQHGFDRIVELCFEGMEGGFTLIVELFSTGNAVLCNDKGVIVSLLESQSWKDRTLSPRMAYAYPPGGVNPAAIDAGEFKTVLGNSGKGVAASVASLGFGGFYAEEICLNAGVDKTADSGSLRAEQTEELFKSLKDLVERADGGAVEASIVLDEGGNYLDVIPFELASYGRNRKIGFKSFNEAVDEYYGSLKSRQFEGKSDGEFKGAMAKLELMREKQVEALARLKGEAERFRVAGDAIYQHLDEVDRLIEQVRKARKQGMGDEEITRRINEGRNDGIAEARMFRDVSGNKMRLDLGG